MEDKIEFPDGIFVKAPHQNAPDFVKGRVTIKLEEAIAYLQSKVAAGEEWLSLDIKESRAGKWYASVDDWQPNSQSREENATALDTSLAPTAPLIDEDDIPF